MAYSRPCREPVLWRPGVARPHRPYTGAITVQKRIRPARAGRIGGEQRARLRRRARKLWLWEVQFHADAIGIVEKELGVAGTRHDALTELYPLGLQALAHAVNVISRKGDMVEPTGILVFLL